MQFDPVVRMLVAGILIAALPTARADDAAATVAPAPEEPVDQKDIKAPEDLGEQTAESDFSEDYDRGIKKDWSTHDFGFMTFKFGIYTLEDWGNTIQSEDAEQQIDVVEGFKVRDFRFSIGGKFATSRPITYTSGIMYDGPTNKWLLREAMRGLLPESVRTRRTKAEFSHTFRRSLASPPVRQVFSTQANARDWVDGEVARRELERFLSGETRNGLWSLWGTYGIHTWAHTLRA